MNRTAHTLRDPSATRFHHIIDASYIPHEADENMMRVVLRSCDYDRFELMTVEEAREDYRKRLGWGWTVQPKPMYDHVEIDEFSLISALHPSA